ncbi:MAG: CDP-diacylglycerol--serine O-phosphatidyltransferase [Desulfobacterota bacterium]|nr:CDP-diacylglycerol--serine O-phosphatidyltransferase [Thermodesulfobacteriota bacterium]MDW8002318.1 CDP-diacylglycerol--serine O-phosphatidyltransferase [Deltaproteobacteria bacterium]
MGKKKVRRIYLLPNIFTSLSLFSGFWAIAEALERNFVHSSSAIFIACVFDILDGRVARITNTTTRFGVEYDSLADLVSFGVAPAILAYLWALSAYGRFGWLAGFLYVACGALRLARFNIQVETVQKKHFLGLPIPASASMIASTVLFCSYLGYGRECDSVFIPLLLYLLAFLMVSNIRYYGFKDFDFVRAKPFRTGIGAILALVVIFMEPKVTIFLISSAYVISGPLSAILQSKRKTIEDFHLERREV